MSARAFVFCRPGPAGVELCLVKPDAPEAARLIVRELGERQALDLAHALVAIVDRRSSGVRCSVVADVKRDGAGLELVVRPRPDVLDVGEHRARLNDRRALELAHELLGRLCAQLAARNAVEVDGVGLPWGSAA